MALTESIYVLDTNVVLYYLGGRLVSPLPSGRYFISVITEIELLSYPTLSSEEEGQIRGFLSNIIVVGVEGNIKLLTIAFRKNYRLKVPDAIIAATAKSLNATLLTNDFRLAGLTEINSQSVQIS